MTFGELGRRPPGRSHGFGAASISATCAVVILFSQPGAGPAVLVAQEAGWPLIGAEVADWDRPSRHDEVLDFLRKIDAMSDFARVELLTTTDEGRPLPAVFLGSPPDFDPADVELRERPTLLVLGAMHGNEPAGREGSLQFIRELALGDRASLLETLNVIVVPQMNPDGSDANQRLNARGYDLNRDWVLAETSEVSAVLDGLIAGYRPDVFVDVHNGGAHPYHLTYQTTLDPTADSDLVAFARGPMYRSVEDHLGSLGMLMYWYSGPEFDGVMDRWYWATTEPWPRKQHSYGGLRDMLTLLFEVPRDHPLEVQATAAREGLVALARFVADRRAEILDVVAQAQRRTLESPPSEIVLELEARAHPDPANFYVLDHENGGRRTVTGENRTLYHASRSRSTPWGYVLDAELGEVAQLLRRHGIQVQVLERPVRVDVERYRVQAIHRSTVPYQHRHRLHIDVDLVSGEATIPAGSFVVPVRQLSGRLIPQLLEPDAIDSVVRWNLLGPLRASQPGSVEFLPIHRLDGPPDLAMD